MLGFRPRLQKREGEHLEENKSFQDLCKICISNFQIEIEYSPFLSLLRTITDPGETIHGVMTHHMPGVS